MIERLFPPDSTGIAVGRADRPVRREGDVACAAHRAGAPYRQFREAGYLVAAGVRR